MSGRFGPRLTRESAIWIERFALDEPLVERAIEGYVQMLEGGALELSDAEAARILAALRKELVAIIDDRDRAPKRGHDLDEMAAKLDRVAENAKLIEDAGFGADLAELGPRIFAARAMLTAIRAAIARRGRTR